MESPWGRCVEDIRCSMNFCDWDVSLGAKDSNKLHLALTQYVFSVDSSFVWMEDCPPVSPVLWSWLAPETQTS